MGYYTDFSISIPKEEPLFKERLELLSGEDFEEYCNNYYANTKWYDYKKDMCKLSKEFPNLKITVCGSGEEPGDIWQDYWLNGKCQHEEIVISFSPFDPQKLQEINE